MGNKRVEQVRDYDSCLLLIGWPILLVDSVFPIGGKGGAEPSMPTYSPIYQSARLSHVLGVQRRKGHKET